MWISNTHEGFFFKEITPEKFYFCDVFAEIDGFDVRIWWLRIQNIPGLVCNIMLTQRLH